MSQTTLFDSLAFAGDNLKNRFVLAPLTRGRAGPTRVPNALMAEYYSQRSTAGLLITEATTVSAQGNGWVNSPGIYTTEMRDGWRAITDAVHAKGSKMILQMWHCGRASHSDFHAGELPLSASAVKLEGDQIHTPEGKKDYEVPRPMTIDDIDRTVDDYRRAAQYAMEAGFDGVEIHAANGYLINQFLDGRSNQRDDEYGGSIENRMRLLKRVVEAVLTVWSPDKVGARISPNGVFNDMGCDDYQALFTAVAKTLNSYKLGYLHVMDGLAFGFHERGEPMTLSDFRPLFDGLIIGNCGYSQETAETALASGQADLIAFGRPYISNPDLPQRMANDWPLAPADDMTYWYTDGAKGYTDYPTYQA
ncbi:alkene reductase [Alteromonas sp. ASW11-36]|uniref:Alkene reductase n=1 Tax=Alteromonas arenosi TaxID=3055817 RepID=A0ABT7T026_9ALTE|nr:alkene reductase [Alteromonas sp. ASW11-36]MDM7861790.1 alkene reductase [Alteromonas sp. ASW11-36]